MMWFYIFITIHSNSHNDLVHSTDSQFVYVGLKSVNIHPCNFKYKLYIYMYACIWVICVHMEKLRWWKLSLQHGEFTHPCSFVADWEGALDYLIQVWVNTAHLYIGFVYAEGQAVKLRLNIPCCLHLIHRTMAVT